MLADRDRARAMGHAGCKKVDPLFTAPRLLRDVDALYTRLLARVRR
jgi:hypothetical protein